MARGFGYSLPGADLTYNSPYARLLVQQRNVNNGTQAGGAAHALQQALLGLMAGQDRAHAVKTREDESAAMQAAAKGMSAKPWVNPDTGTVPPGQVAGGYEGAMAALSRLPDNRFAGRLTSDLAMRQAERRHELEDYSRQRADTLADYERQRTDKAAETEADRAFRLKVEAMKGNRSLREKFDAMMMEDKLARDRIDYEKGMGGGGGPAGAPAIPGAAPGPEGAPGASPAPTGPRVGSLGVPLPDTDPLADLPISEKGKFAAKIREDAITRFGKSQESVDQARNTAERLNRFVMLLDEGLDTGGKYAIPFADDVAAAVSPQVAEAKSIVDMMTPMMRQGMPGAASDRDVRMFKGATVGLGKPEQANRNIAAGLIASRQNLIQRHQFMETYFDQNHHLQGADRAWQSYLEANPIFDPNAPEGSYAMNPSRQSWPEFFAAGGKPQQAPGGAPTLPPGWSIQRVPD